MTWKQLAEKILKFEDQDQDVTVVINGESFGIAGIDKVTDNEEEDDYGLDDGHYYLRVND